MDLWTLVLRTAHIFGGFFWVGAVFLMLFFIEPTARLAVPEGPRFMGRLVLEKRLTEWITFAVVLNVGAGIVLYWRDSGGLQIFWIGTAPGIAFTIGSVAGIVALVLGLSIIGPTIKRLATLGREIDTAGRPPSPEQLAELQRLQQRLVRVNQLDLILVTLAMLTMATARYWTF